MLTSITKIYIPDQSNDKYDQQSKPKMLIYTYGWVDLKPLSLGKLRQERYQMVSQ